MIQGFIQFCTLLVFGKNVIARSIIKRYSILRYHCKAEKEFLKIYFMIFIVQTMSVPLDRDLSEKMRIFRKFVYPEVFKAQYLRHGLTDFKSKVCFGKLVHIPFSRNWRFFKIYILLCHYIPLKKILENRIFFTRSVTSHFRFWSDVTKQYFNRN